MPRIYSNYSEEEFKLMLKESKKYGMTLSTFQKYRSLLGLIQSDNSNEMEIDLTVLIDKLINNLMSRPIGEPFIVSALLPDEWVRLNRSQKMVLSKSLKKIVDDNVNCFSINVLSDNTNQYTKIKQFN